MLTEMTAHKQYLIMGSNMKEKEWQKSNSLTDVQTNITSIITLH